MKIWLFWSPRCAFLLGTKLGACFTIFPAFYLLYFNFCLPAVWVATARSMGRSCVVNVSGLQRISRIFQNSGHGSCRVNTTATTHLALQKDHTNHGKPPGYCRFAESCALRPLDTKVMSIHWGWYSASNYEIEGYGGDQWSMILFEMWVSPSVDMFMFINQSASLLDFHLVFLYTEFDSFGIC